MWTKLEFNQIASVCEHDSTIRDILTGKGYHKVILIMDTQIDPLIKRRKYRRSLKINDQQLSLTCKTGL